jgi:hypothetical protein
MELRKISGPCLESNPGHARITFTILTEQPRLLQRVKGNTRFPPIKEKIFKAGNKNSIKQRKNCAILTAVTVSGFRPRSVLQVIIETS